MRVASAATFYLWVFPLPCCGARANLTQVKLYHQQIGMVGHDVQPDECGGILQPFILHYIKVSNTGCL